MSVSRDAIDVLVVSKVRFEERKKAIPTASESQSEMPAGGSKSK